MKTSELSVISGSLLESVFHNLVKYVIRTLLELIGTSVSKFQFLFHINIGHYIFNKMSNPTQPAQFLGYL